MFPPTTGRRRRRRKEEEAPFLLSGGAQQNPLMPEKEEEEEEEEEKKKKKPAFLCERDSEKRCTKSYYNVFQTSGMCQKNSPFFIHFPLKIFLVRATFSFLVRVFFL